MSSPPYSGPLSPPGPTSLKRSATGSNPQSSKRRKPSRALSATSSSHPLRQASFPPPDSQTFSPQSRQASFSPAVEGSVSSFGGGGSSSLVAAPRSAKGRPRKGKANGASTTGGSSARGGRGKAAAAAAAEEEEEDDEDEGDDEAMAAVNEMDVAEAKREGEHRMLLYEQMNDDQRARYDAFQRAGFKKAIVRKMVNQTLSQSVPQPIVFLVSGVAKVFVGDLVERARDVQEQELAAATRLPTGEVKTVAGLERKSDGDGESGGGEQREKTRRRTVENAFFDVNERDRGPLTPDHLREALRRYRSDREGATTGFGGLSLHGRDAVASRTRGKRLFR